MYIFNIIGLIRKVPFLIVIFYFGCIPVSHIIVGETREPVDPSSVELYLDYPQEYEKIADTIMEAIRSGKFIYDLSGNAR